MSNVVGIICKVEGNNVLLAVYNNDTEKLDAVRNISSDMIVGTLSSYSIKPLNFTVSGGKVIDDAGKFERLSAPHKVFIVIAEIKSRGGRCLGYRCLDTTTGEVTNMRKEDILSMQQRVTTGTSVLQNAVVRGGKINCYPNHPFRRIIVGARNKGRKPVERSLDASLNAKPKSTDMYMKKAKKMFGDASFIANPKLSEEQKAILIKAKSNGASVDYFNNPDLSKGAMKFYAKRLVDDSIAKDCEEMLNHPKLKLAQLNELYECAITGVDYSEVCDENISPQDMSIFRTKKQMEMWGDLETVAPVDEELIDKCLNYADLVRMNR